MSRLFISHCTKDQKAIQELVEFLVSGMGIPRSDIFCTSQSGTLPPDSPSSSGFGTPWSTASRFSAF